MPGLKCPVKDRDIFGKEMLGQNSAVMALLRVGLCNTMEIRFPLQFVALHIKKSRELS
jgi:hypothetical protein